VTYRDDNDAALARADSLEHQVHELERERDELRAKLEVAEHGKPFPSAPGSLAPPLPGMPAAALPREVEPLTPSQLRHLLEALEAGASQMRRANGQTLLGAGVLTALTPFAYMTVHALAMVTGAFAAFLFVGYGIGRAGADESSWRPVLDAIRDEPDRIVAIEDHSEGGAKDRLIISTFRHSLELRTAQSASLAGLLARRCRYARVTVD
jgi:hypothetical protein